MNVVELASSKCQAQAADHQGWRQVGIVLRKDFAVGNVYASFRPLSDQACGYRIAGEVERDLVHNSGAKRAGQGNGKHLTGNIRVRRRQIWQRGAEEKSALLSG